MSKTKEVTIECENCLYCLCKCPKCGDWHIEVKAIINGREWSIDNDTENSMMIESQGEVDVDDFFDGDDSIDILCQRCDYWKTTEPTPLWSKIANIVESGDSWYDVDCGEVEIKEIATFLFVTLKVTAWRLYEESVPGNAS